MRKLVMLHRETEGKRTESFDFHYDTDGNVSIVKEDEYGVKTRLDLTEEVIRVFLEKKKEYSSEYPTDGDFTRYKVW